MGHLGSDQVTSVVDIASLNLAGYFYIIQTSSDRLENNFRIYCTMDCSHNVDILQLSHRASQAAEVLWIFVSNPELD
jgi:hypothetical protein